MLSRISGGNTGRCGQFVTMWYCKTLTDHAEVTWYLMFVAIDVAIFMVQRVKV